MPKEKLTAAAKLEDGSYIIFDLSMPINSLCRKIGAQDVETLVFGKIDANDNILWEKTFTGGLVDHAFLKRAEDAQSTTNS